MDACLPASAMLCLLPRAQAQALLEPHALSTNPAVQREVFETAEAAQVFVTALEETTVTYGWQVHAYVVMRNHYHAAIETPEPNLVGSWRLALDAGHLGHAVQPLPP